MSAKSLRMLRVAIKASVEDLAESLFMMEEREFDEEQYLDYALDAMKESGEMLALLGDVIAELEKAIR